MLKKAYWENAHHFAGTLYDLRQGLANFFFSAKVQVVNILSFADHKSLSQLNSAMGSMKPAVNSMQMNEHGSVPIKFDLQT